MKNTNDSISKSLLEVFFKVKKNLSHNKQEQSITASDYFLLLSIKEKASYEKAFDKEVISTSALSKELKMSKAALAKQTKKLEKLGLINKNLLLINLKNKYISLTTKGFDLIEEKKDEYLEIPKIIIDEMGEEESIHLVNLLNKVDNIIENLRKQKKQII